MSRPNAKHERFAQFLADGLAQHEAYEKAGFSAKGARGSASALLKRNTSISKRVAAILEERALIAASGVAKAIDATALDKTYVLTKLAEIVDMGMAARPVLNTKGEPTGEYSAQLNAANRALELIGKEQGMFVERKEVRTGPLDDLGRDELKRLRDLLSESAGEATSAIARAAAPATSSTDRGD